MGAMKLSVQLTLERSTGPNLSKDEIASRLDDVLCSNDLWLDDTSYKVESVAFITGARPVTRSNAS